MHCQMASDCLPGTTLWYEACVVVLQPQIKSCLTRGWLPAERVPTPFMAATLVGWLASKWRE